MGRRRDIGETLHAGKERETGGVKIQKNDVKINEKTWGWNSWREDKMGIKLVERR